MLQDIRNNAQGTIAKVIIGLLIVSLSIWGMDAIVGGFSGEPEVATVNGEDITEREFLRVVQMESQRRLSRMENPDPSMLDEDQIRTDVLDSLIQEQVLIQDANAQGLELNDADIDALITQMPQFQVDGQFNRDRFVATVRNMGMGVGEFREAMRKQYVVNQIRAGIVQSGLVADENAEQLLQIQNQTRSFRVLDIPASSVADAVSVSDADVEAFYEENSGAFQQPERVDAAYITLSLGALAESIEVDDAELQAYYEQQAADLASEERRASHILIEEGSDADETMATIQERLAAGSHLLTWRGSIPLIPFRPKTAATWAMPVVAFTPSPSRKPCLPLRKAKFPSRFGHRSGFILFASRMSGSPRCRLWMKWKTSSVVSWPVKRLVSSLLKSGQSLPTPRMPPMIWPALPKSSGLRCGRPTALPVTVVRRRLTTPVWYDSCFPKMSSTRVTTPS